MTSPRSETLAATLVRGIPCIIAILLVASAASAQFVDVTVAPLGGSDSSFGVAWGDYDGDGDPDLYITSSTGTNRLFRNDGGGVFTDVTATPLDDTGSGRGAAWGDYDNDGDLDLYLANYDGANRLFRNEGGGSFTDVTAVPVDDGGYGTTVAWGDYDGDGLLDLYLCCVGPNRLFRNLGGGAFEDATVTPLDDGGNTESAAWGDYDDDGDLDLYIVNFGQANRLMRNEGDGTFVDATTSPLGDSGTGTGAAWGDYDNDGDLDLYLANNLQANILFRNDGGDIFTDATTLVLEDMGTSGSVSWVDYDHDGLLDLFMTTDGRNKLFRNTGASFWETTGAPLDEVAYSRGVGWADFDADGDLDPYIANGLTNRLYRNDATAGQHWLQVSLKGRTCNGTGIGARVTVETAGLAQIREVSGGSGYVSQDAMVCTFGLGADDLVNRVEVRWPGGAVEEYFDVAVDQRVTLVEGVVFADAADALLADPGSGRGAAWGDYDGDGDHDLYLSNAASANALFRNEGDGSFTDATTGLLGSTLVSRSCVWGDYDNDGDPDLYVVNWGQSNLLLRNDGVEFVNVSLAPMNDDGYGTASAWGDYDDDGFLDLYVSNGGGNNRMFHNEGDGTFVNVASGYPLWDGSNSHGVAWADYDDDGDQDFYLANYVNNNKLVRNNGDGTFGAQHVPEDNFAMSMGVAWGDYDNDGDMDVYVTNDGPNFLMRNDGDQVFTEVTQPPLDDDGVGRGVAWLDYDNDGDLDLYLVNTATANRLFMNLGDDTFSDVTGGPLAHAGLGFGLACADYDADGDLDMYVTNSEQPNLLLRNDCTNDNHWLHVDLVGVDSNASAIGRRVRVVAGNLDQIREIGGGSSYLSQNSLTAEFGLGTETSVDLVEIVWPSGVIQSQTDVAVDQRITFVEEPPYPLIRSIEDVPDDQGGWVRIRFARSAYDHVDETETPVTAYDVFRRVEDPELIAAVTGLGAKASHGERSGLVRHDGRTFLVGADKAAPEGVWEVVASLHARQQTEYLCLAPTLADTPPSATCSTFFVSAYTTTPTFYIDGPTADGCSADNLAPGVPVEVSADYGRDAVVLDWSDATENDFQYYRVYRGTSPGFEISAETLIHETVLSAWTDETTNPWFLYYRITTLDHAGNESESASPDPLTGVGREQLPARTALLEAVPNPFNPHTSIAFELAVGGRAKLAVYDAAGRLVAVLADGEFEAGRHERVWDGRDGAGRPAPAGVYLYRLETVSGLLSRSMTLIK